MVVLEVSFDNGFWAKQRAETSADYSLQTRGSAKYEDRRGIQSCCLAFNASGSLLCRSTSE
jgi:hypothetical protein